MTCGSHRCHDASWCVAIVFQATSSTLVGKYEFGAGRMAAGPLALVTPEGHDSLPPATSDRMTTAHTGGKKRAWLAKIVRKQQLQPLLHRDLGWSSEGTGGSKSPAAPPKPSPDPKVARVGADGGLEEDEDEDHLQAAGSIAKVTLPVGYRPLEQNASEIDKDHQGHFDTSEDLEYMEPSRVSSRRSFDGDDDDGSSEDEDGAAIDREWTEGLLASISGLRNQDVGKALNILRDTFMAQRDRRHQDGGHFTDNSDGPSYPKVSAAQQQRPEQHHPIGEEGLPQDILSELALNLEANVLFLQPGTSSDPVDSSTSSDPKGPNTATRA